MGSLLPSTTYASIAVAILVVRSAWLSHNRLSAFPIVGSNNWLGSWWASLKYLTNVVDLLQEGYEKYKSAPFKIPSLSRWTVIFSSLQHTEELLEAPGDILSFPFALNDRFQMEYTMSPGTLHNQYHLPIVRSQLTRSIGTLYPEIRNEIMTTFDDMLDLKGSEWSSVPALDAARQVICRTSNRVFVGLPLCRDPEWVKLNIQYTLAVFKGAFIIGLFPRFLKPLITRLFTSIPQNMQLGKRLLGPMIEERRKYLNEYGNKWADKPNDVLTWLMEAAEGPESTLEALTTRTLVLNFAAIHTTSNSFGHVLIYLAANPQYIQPLREEVDDIVQKEGWTKASLGKMRKVDSFLKECQRLEGISALSVTRKALKDFTFSDGTFIPKGTTIAVPTLSLHRDEQYYENADSFEPFRFAEMSEEEGVGGKHRFVSTAPEFLPFGHGKGACPGRFFAVNEMKTMLAHIVATYDIKLEDGAKTPRTVHFLASTIPDPSAKVMFRKRVD